MKIAIDPNSSHYSIKRYSAASIRINDTDYQQSIIISADHLLTNWVPQTLDELKPEHFNPILELKPSVVLLGVGEQHQFPAAALLKVFYQHRIGVEVMTTPAACRTFNVLVNEGRAVVAALMRG